VWLTDKNEALSMFLTYGKDLSTEELEFIFEVDDEGKPLITPSSPKLVDFQTKVPKINSNTFCGNNVYIF